MPLKLDVQNRQKYTSNFAFNTFWLLYYMFLEDLHELFRLTPSQVSKCLGLPHMYQECCSSYGMLKQRSKMQRQTQVLWCLKHGILEGILKENKRYWVK